MTGFVVGEVDAVVRRAPGLLFEDDFRNGPSGWTQLMEGTLGQGPVVLDSEITFDNSRYSLLLSTEDYSFSAAKPWSTAMAIKRLSRGTALSEVYVEWWWGFGALHGENAIRNIDFGIDYADPSGSRRFFKIRWLNHDGSSRVSKYQLRQSDGTYVDVADGAINHGYNENKRNLFHLEAVFDITNSRYDGLRVNGDGFGSLASTPDASLNSYSPPEETLAAFSGGFNVAVQLSNRLETNSSKCWANLAYCRAVAS